MMVDKLNIVDVWAVEQEILDVIHDICIKNNIKYTLFYGTLLGAVRHKGFIPWDDDIDLVMLREDYERFIFLWKQIKPKGYLLQNQFTNVDYPNTFTKICKDHTTFLQNDEARDKTYHKGFFVDIFPADRVATTFVGQKIQYVFAAIHLLYTRGYSSGSKGIIGLIEHMLLKIPRKFYPNLRDFSGKLLRMWNRHTDNQLVCFNTIKDCKIFYPADSFDRTGRIVFNEKEYCSVENTHLCLKAKYGDYMKLPPEEERKWFHHPILVDFENNFEDIVEKGE